MRFRYDNPYTDTGALSMSLLDHVDAATSLAKKMNFNFWSLEFPLHPIVPIMPSMFSKHEK